MSAVKRKACRDCGRDIDITMAVCPHCCSTDPFYHHRNLDRVSVMVVVLLVCVLVTTMCISGYMLL